MNIELNNKFLDDYKIKITNLTQMIKKFRDDIHKTYLNLGTNLHKKVDIALDKTTKEFLDFLLLFDNGTSNKTDEDGLLQLLHNYENQLNKLTNPIRKKRDRGSESFSESLKYLSEINSMLQSVDVIQDFASEMEILSINSIILASKSGTKGVGFRSISTNINKLSKETNLKFEDLKKISKQVLDRYNSYNYLIISTRNFRIKKSDIIKNQSNEFFSNSVSVTKDVSELIKKMIKNIKSTKSGIFNIILELQNEDIINQILSNLIHQLYLISEFIQNLEIDHKNENTKNEYLFILEIDKFLLEKIKRVEASLKRLLTLLEQNLHTFSSISKECFTSLDTVSKKLKNDHKNNNYFSNNFLYESKTLAREYKILVSQIIKYQNNINKTGKEFMNNLDKVDKIYYILEKIIDKMKSVNVLVKIELVKENIETLSKSNTGNVMENILIKIDNYLKELVNNFRDTKIKLSELMGQINDSVINQKNKFKYIKNILNEFIDNFLEKSLTFQDGIDESMTRLNSIFNEINIITDFVGSEITNIKALLNLQNNEIRALEGSLESTKNILLENYKIDKPSISEITDKEFLEILEEVEKRQDKASLNKYLEESFNFEDNEDNVEIFT